MSFVFGKYPVITSAGPLVAKDLSANAAPVMVRENEGRVSRSALTTLFQGNQPRAAIPRTELAHVSTVCSLLFRPRLCKEAEAHQIPSSSGQAAAPLPLRQQRTPYMRSAVNEARHRAIDGSLSILRQNAAVVERRFSVLEAYRRTYETTEPDEATRQKISKMHNQCMEVVEDLHGLADLIREQQVICERASFSS